MASPVYITALNPDLSFHVREDRSPGPRRIILARDDPDEDVEVDEQETERRLQEMDRDDDTYRGTTDSMDKGSGPGRRRGQGEGETGGIDYALPRTASPDSITPTPARAMTRTVTINEPIHDSIEKNSEASSPDLTSVSTPYPTRRGRRRRTFSISRTGTASSFGSFSTFVSDSWGQRKDRAHKGFWAAVWAWMAGSKAEGELGPREGHPDYIPPKYRWTLILSGLLQPFSILLEIPGLTEHWYVHTVNKGPVAYKPNPVLLDVGLAISMACAVVANIALISRFLERRVLPSTVITIVGLSIHDLINIVAVTVFGVIHRFDDGFSFSEGAFLRPLWDEVAS